MPDINILNIPAYQRKRSIAAKERAFNIKKTRPRKPEKVTRKRFEKIDPINEISIPQDLPVENLFPAPISPTLKQPGKFKEMNSCGICEGYFEKINVAVLKLTKPLKIGDIILLEKPDGLFQQEVKSMQINRKEVKIARTGSEIGIKVTIKPKMGGTIYKVVS